MQRTNVYLTEEQAREINRRATFTRRPKAAIIREVIDKGLQLTSIQQSESTRAFMRIAEIAEQFRDKGTAPEDLSSNLDKHLWDE